MFLLSKSSCSELGHLISDAHTQRKVNPTTDNTPGVSSQPPCTLWVNYFSLKT